MPAFLGRDPTGTSPIWITFLRIADKRRMNGRLDCICRIQHQSRSFGLTIRSVSSLIAKAPSVLLLTQHQREYRNHEKVVSVTGRIGGVAAPWARNSGPTNDSRTNCGPADHSTPGGTSRDACHAHWRKRPPHPRLCGCEADRYFPLCRRKDREGGRTHKCDACERRGNCELGKLHNASPLGSERALRSAARKEDR